MQLANPRLWQLNDPYLYRMTGRISAAGSQSVDETSTRFGFRDFRFENGYFRLNGQPRILAKRHTGADGPGSIRLPHDPDLLRRDLLDLKAMGFNGVRFISTMPQRYQLEMCDEIGLMVYEESYASWHAQDSPKLAERMDRSLTGMVLRDRNHPSIVMWGLLNETGQGNVFNHAVASLPLMRRLDDSRIVMLGSGRFDTVGNCHERFGGMEAGGWLCAMPDPQPEAIRDLLRHAMEAEGGRHDSRRQRRVQHGPLDRAGRWRLYRYRRNSEGSGTFTTTDVHVLAGRKAGVRQFHQLEWTRRPSAHIGRLGETSKGQTLDFVVGGRTPAGGDGTCDGTTTRRLRLR